MGMLSFLQENGQWICAAFTCAFIGIQVWLMHTQNRQQIRLQRLDLAQKLNEACARFPNSKEECDVVMQWLMGHAASFTFLLNKKDMKKYWFLYELVHKFRICKDEQYFENMENRNKFIASAIDLENTVREASYGIPNYHRKINWKFLKGVFHAKH